MKDLANTVLQSLAKQWNEKKDFEKMYELVEEVFFENGFRRRPSLVLPRKIGFLRPFHKGGLERALQDLLGKNKDGGKKDRYVFFHCLVSPEHSGFVESSARIRNGFYTNPVFGDCVSEFLPLRIHGGKIVLSDFSRGSKVYFPLSVKEYDRIRKFLS